MEMKELNEEIAGKYAKIWKIYTKAIIGIISNAVLFAIIVALFKDFRTLMLTNELATIIALTIVFGTPIVYFIISIYRPTQEIDNLRKTRRRKVIPEKYWKSLKIDK